MTQAAAGPSGQEVGLGLGSNVGDKVWAIREAVDLLGRRGIVKDIVLSRFYRTAPWGHVQQDWFVNACACGSSDLPPLDLLAAVKAIETELGRVETVRWGPRVIDIDILYYGAVELNSPALTLPHKDMLERAFVLAPLAELRPDLRIRGTSLRQAIERLGQQGVAPLDPT